MPKKKSPKSILDTPTKRAALAPAKEPYWERLQGVRGAALGLYVPATSPARAWRLRVRVGSRYAYDVLGPVSRLDYAAAVARAGVRAAELRAEAERPEAPPAPALAATLAAYRYTERDATTYTVADALSDYAAMLAAEGKPSAASIGYARPLLAALATRPLAALSAGDVLAWRDGAAATAPLHRGRGAARDRPLEAMPHDAADETRRRRRVRVNRVLGILKAALNRTAPHVQGLRPGALESWRGVKLFQKVARGRLRLLTVEDVGKLLDAAPSAQFRDLAHAAVLTGARAAELSALRVRDYRREDGKIHFARTKDEKETGRTVALSPEGVALFERLTAGREPAAVMLPSPSGRAWRRAEQVRPMRVATLRAGLVPRPVFHDLRGCYAVSLLRAGVALEVVSKLLGHSSIELTRKHYADFVQSDLDAAAVRLPAFTRPPAGVARIAGRRIAVRQ